MDISFLNIKNIYVEKDIKNQEAGSFSLDGEDVLSDIQLKYNNVISKFPNAKIKTIDNWQKILELSNEEARTNFVRTKRENLVIANRKSFLIRENGRSTDFIAPNSSHGCQLSCNYCYVNRHTGYAQPITLFINNDHIIKAIDTHLKNKGHKKEANQCHPLYWTYDIGESNDCSIDDLISSNIKETIQYFANTKYGMASFATKFVNRNLLNYNPKGHTRIRFSLMPQSISTKVDIRCSKISDRINAINDFVEAGYEVHVNFSPIIVYNGWENDWRELLKELDAALSDKAKKQLKCEVIFLTHNTDLHKVNLKWNAIGEELLWSPEVQESKISENGMTNIRYKYILKSKYIDTFKKLLVNTIPYCEIRYIF